MSPGQRILFYGIIGGPFPGVVKRKGKSKDCWIVKVRIRPGEFRFEEVHEDYLRERANGKKAAV